MFYSVFAYVHWYLSRCRQVKLNECWESSHTFLLHINANRIFVSLLIPWTPPAQKCLVAAKMEPYESFFDEYRTHRHFSEKILHLECCRHMKVGPTL